MVRGVERAIQITTQNFRVEMLRREHRHSLGQRRADPLELMDEEVGLRVLSTAESDQLNAVPLCQLSILVVREARDALES